MLIRCIEDNFNSLKLNVIDVFLVRSIRFVDASVAEWHRVLSVLVGGGGS